jgi:hypothetical protein
MSLAKRPRELEYNEMKIYYNKDLRFTSVCASDGVTYLSTSHALYAKMDGAEHLMLVSGDEKRHSMRDGIHGVSSFLSIHAVVRYSKGLLVLDHNRVRIVSFNGNVDTLDVEGPDHDQMMQNPVDIVQDIDSPSTFYISDPIVNKIFTLYMYTDTEEWDLQELCGSDHGADDGVFEVARFGIPHGLSMKEAGRLLVADSGNKAIREIDIHARTVTTLFHAEFQPYSVLCLNDKIIFSMPDKPELRMWDGSGVTCFGPHLGIYPCTISSDSSGNILFLREGEVYVLETQSIGVECRFKKRTIEQASTKRLQDGFKDMFESKKYCDLTLLVGNTKFEIHKAVLSARNEVFCTLLEWEAHKSEVKINFQEIEDEHASCAFRLLLRYFYSGELPSIDELEQHGLLEALVFMCGLYTEDNLLDHCVKIYRRLLSGDIFIKRLVLAHELKLDVLKKAAMDYIQLPEKAWDFSFKWVGTLKILRPIQDLFDTFVDELMEAQTICSANRPVGYGEGIYRRYWFRTLKLLRPDAAVFDKVIDHWSEQSMMNMEPDEDEPLWRE